MAKRFYDTQRIEEDWYIDLSCKHRELLRYCESKCDGAGVFSFNEKIASTYINEKISAADLEKLPVKKLENGKYFLVGFCQFQNGELSEKSPAHKPILKSIAENGITENTLYNRVSDTLSNRVQEKEKVIVKEKGKEKVMEGKSEKTLHVRMREMFCEEYKRSTGITYDYNGIDGKKINELEKSIRVTIRDKIDGYNDEDVYETFKILIQNLPKWYKDNAFDLKTIAGNYSKIIAQLNINSNANKVASVNAEVDEYIRRHGNPYAREGT